MLKPKKLLLLFSPLVFPLFLFADDITVTTYYPSPYGSYNELQTNKLAVGDTNNSGGLEAGDQPPADGQLYTARSVIYKPQSSLPASNAMQGEVVYNSSDNLLYLYNGSAWVKQSGGGGCYVSYSGSCLAGFTNEGSVGYWGYCTYEGPQSGIPGSIYLVYHPPGAHCVAPGWTDGWIDSQQAIVCCQ